MKPDASAMRNDDFLGDGQPKSDPMRFFGPGYPEEPFKNARLKLLWNARPVIENREANSFANRFH